MKHKIFIISGPGGVGKGTIIKAVLKKKKFNLARGMNITTRTKRPADHRDPHYIYTAKDKFKAMIKKGEILEYNFLDGQYYGTDKAHLLNGLKNHNILMEVDVNGGMRIKEKMKQAVLIFISTGLKDIEKRIRKRGDTSEAHLKYRLELAKKEKQKSAHYDYRVQNPEGQLKTAVKKVLQIIEKELQKK